MRLKLPDDWPWFWPMATIFGVHFLATGMSLQWVPVWYEEIGIAPEMIGVIVAATMFGRFTGAPLIGILVDKFSAPRRIFAGLSLMLAAIYALHLTRPEPWLLVILGFGLGLGIGPMVPLLDAKAIGLSATRGLHYGRARAIGSLTFILASMMGGVLIAYVNEDAVLWWLIGAFLLSALFARLIPDDEEQGPETRPPVTLKLIGQALGSKRMVMMLAASALIQGSHAFYYSFSTIAWRSQGLSEITIGWLWAWGVVAEILVLIFLGRTMERLGARVLILIGAASAAIRWTIYAFEPPLGALFALQTFHAGTFAAAHMGFVVFARAAVPHRYRTSAQAMNSALTLGGVLAGATAVSGWLYAHYGSLGYLLMTALGLAGALCVILVDPREMERISVP
jgi:MFS transporter, PPP family, 3-phenylpropionic acid transporter